MRSNFPETNPAKRLWQCQSGAIAPIFGVLISFLVFLLAGSIEVLRWIDAKNEVQMALDAATLAAATKLRANSADTAGATTTGQASFTANISKMPLTANRGLGASFVFANEKVTGTVTGTINSITGSLIDFGFELGAVSEVSLPNPTDKFEISLMLDITGSMCNSDPGLNGTPCTNATDLNAMKAAANSLVDTVLANEELKKRVRIAVVPFSDGVRPPANVLTSIRGPTPPVTPFSYTQTTGSGSNKKTQTYTVYYHPTECVGERIGVFAYSDALPTALTWFPTAMRQGQSQTNSTPMERACSMPANSEVAPLSNDPAAIKSKIQGLSANGMTAGHLGTAWSWYTLSPLWASIWPGTANDPAPYAKSKDDTSIRKIAILMTDGDYNMQYSLGSGVAMPGVYINSSISKAYSTSTLKNNGTAIAQTQQLCTNMKASPNFIEVYTVGFGVSNTAWTLLQSCATDGNHAFRTTSPEELAAAFSGIANQVLAMFISR